MIKISSLKKPRRDGKAEFTYLDEEAQEVLTREIPISFLKPTEALWDELTAMETAAKAEGEQGDAAKKELYVRQLIKVEIQSPEIVEDDGRPHSITADDLRSLDFVQVMQLHAGVMAHFFLRTPTPKQETNTNSSSEQAAAA